MSKQRRNAVKTAKNLATLTKGAAKTAVAMAVGAKIAGIPGAAIAAAKPGVDLVKDTIKIIRDERGQHPEWYTKDLPDGTRGIVSANFARRKGIVELGQKYSISSGETRNQSMCLSGKISLASMPGEDSSNGWIQGINRMYNSIRRANAGAINFSPADLEKYILTVRSCYIGYNVIARGYKTTLAFTATDATTPESIFAAEGIDAVTFSENAADIYNKLIQWRKQLETVLVLNIPLIDRTNWLFSNVFKDSDNVKASYFAFAADDTLCWSGKEWVWLDFSGDVSATATGMTWEVIKREMQKAIDYFTTNSTFQIIAGDILRAYGKEGQFKLPMIEPNSCIQPIYDAYALTQVQNAVCFSHGFEYSFVLGTSATGFVNPQPLWNVAGKAIQFKTDNGGAIANCIQQILLNSPKDDISDGEILSYSRLAFYPVIDGGPDGDGFRVNVDAHGTEVVKGMMAYVISPQLDNGDDNPNYKGLLGVSQGINIYGDGTPDYSEMTAMFRTTACWGQLDWSPRCLFLMYMNNQTAAIAANLWDTDVYALVTEQEMDTYSGWANLSLLHVASLYKESKTQTVVD